MRTNSRISESGYFPQTKSVIYDILSDNAAVRGNAFAEIAAFYWRPIYKYIRLKWNKPGEDAKDLTQSFLLVALEKDYFQSYRAEKGRFRTFVRSCIDHFILNVNQTALRQKRGGHLKRLEFDFEGADGELRTLQVAGDQSIEDLYDMEWTRNLFASSLLKLEQYCKSEEKLVQMEIFRAYDLAEQDHRPTYAQLAKTYNLPQSQVTNYLAFARGLFKQILVDHLRAITSSDEEFDAELKFVLGRGIHD